jgi:hypothetical protein
MYRSSQDFTPLRTAMVSGYVMEERDSDGMHNNLGRETDLDFSAILKALRAMLCLPRAERPI